MNGGLYRSAHAASEGEPPIENGVTLISVDSRIPADSRMSVDSRMSGVVPVQRQPLHRHRAILPDDTRPGSAGDESGNTVGNSAVMAVGSLVSRLIGFARNALIGMTLGAGIGDAYTTAQFLPGQIYELLLGGILSSVLIPLLVRRRKVDPDGGQEFTRKLLTFAIVSLGLATLLVVAAAPLITAIQSGDTGKAYQDLVTHFAYLILPIIFFTGLSALIGAVLNVRGEFAAPVWAPILNNLVVIATCAVFIVVFGTAKGITPEDMTGGRVLLIGLGTLLGMVVQALGLLPALRKVGFTWRWRWDPRSLGLREIGRLAGWMLCYVGANQVAVFAVVRILNRVAGNDSASVLAFNNVFLLTMMAHGIIGVSVMTPLLPKMSAAAAEGRYAEVSADLSRGIRLTAAAMAPIAVVYGVLGVPIAVTLFQGGAYGNDAALATGTVLVVAAFAVLPLSISYLCTYTFYSLQGNKTAALINLPVAAVRIGAYFVLAAVLDKSLSAAGMTAGNAISYVVSAVISLSVLRRRIGRLNLGAVAVALAKVFASAAVAAVLGLVVVRMLPGAGSPDGRGQALVQIVAGGVVIFVAYLGTAAMLRVQEVNQVVSMARRKFRRR